MEQLTTCPLCGNNRLPDKYEIKDHFFTGESFLICECSSCGFLFTNPRPISENLHSYYESPAYFSHRNTRKSIAGLFYHLIRRIAIRNKHKIISRYKKCGAILDIGCGTGELLNYFKNKGWKASGIEPAFEPRKFAIENYGLEIFEESSLDYIPEKSFDVITLWHVLEHVPNLHNRILQIKRLLKDDGVILFALPNHESYDARHYKEFWAAWDVPRHLYHFSKNTFTRLMNNHDLKIIDILPMKFDSYYVSLLSEKFKKSPASPFKAFIFGFMSNIAARQNGNNYSSQIYVIKM